MAAITTKTAKPCGRPTKFREEYVSQLIEFFDVPCDKEVQRVGANGRIVRAIGPSKFPTFSRFAACIGVTRTTLRSWAIAMKKDGTPVNPAFAFAYEQAKGLQAALLIEGALAGTYESRMACLMLQNVVGWHWKPAVESKAAPDVSIETMAELERVYARGMAAMQTSRKAGDFMEPA